MDYLESLKNSEKFMFPEQEHLLLMRIRILLLTILLLIIMNLLVLLLCLLVHQVLGPIVVNLHIWSTHVTLYLIARHLSWDIHSHGWVLIEPHLGYMRGLFWIINLLFVLGMQIVLELLVGGIAHCGSLVGVDLVALIWDVDSTRDLPRIKRLP